MKLAAEKSLNRAIYPVICTKGKRPQFPQEIWKCRKKVFGISGYWDSKCMMLMDVLATKRVHYLYGFVTPSNLDFKYNTQMMKGEDLRLLLTQPFDEKKNTLNTSITDDDLRHENQSLASMSSKEIYSIVMRASSCLFSLRYPVRYLDSDTKKIKTFPVDISDSKLMSVDIENIRTSKNGNILERMYSLKFNNLFGYLFNYNVQAGNFNWVDEDFYNLSEHSQLFHRLMILHRTPGILKIKLSDIIHRLNLQTTSPTATKRIMENILSELKNADIISDFEVDENKKGRAIFDRYVIHYSYNNNPNSNNNLGRSDNNQDDSDKNISRSAIFEIL